ncbi:MAG: tetratricopeptide repeat protein [Bacteroidales bacterium]|nr:tetratricopeptide repeat protein [Bacteroidales bacterium]
MKKAYLIIIFTLYSFQLSFSQYEKIDSFLNLKTTENELSIYYQIADFYFYSNPDTAMFFYKKALNLSIKQKDTSSILFIYQNLGSLETSLRNINQSENYCNLYLSYCRNLNDSSAIFSNIATMNILKGEYFEALKYFDELLPFYKKNGDTINYINVLINSAVILSRKSLYDKATERLYEAIDLSSKISDKENLASIFQNLGEIFGKQKNYSKSVEYFHKALLNYTLFNNKLGICGVYVNLGTVYIDAKNLDSANYFLQKALELSTENNFSAYKSIIYYNFGQIEYAKKNYNQALDFYKNSILIHKKFQNNQGSIYNYLAIASCLSEINDFSNAQKYCDSALYFSKSIGVLELEAECYKTYADIFFKNNNYLKTINNLNLYIKTTDSLEIISQNEQILNLEYIYQTQKKENEIIKLNYESELKNTEIKRRKTINYILIIGFSFLIFAFIIISKLTKQKQKLLNEKKLIEAKIKSEEQIKEQIALELHDNIGGSLAAFIAEIPDNKNKLQIQDIYNKIRMLSHTLSEPVFTEVTLQQKINALIISLTQISNINIHFFDDFSLFWRNIKDHEEIQKTLYRITQELITNAIKHANCQEIELQLINTENEIRLLYNDDGVGFDVVNKKTGIGLENISKRAKYLNGKLKIESKINHGTTIILIFPYYNI